MTMKERLGEVYGTKGQQFGSRGSLSRQNRGLAAVVFIRLLQSRMVVLFRIEYMICHDRKKGEGLQFGE